MHSPPDLLVFLLVREGVKLQPASLTYFPRAAVVTWPPCLHSSSTPTRCMYLRTKLDMFVICFRSRSAHATKKLLRNLRVVLDSSASPAHMAIFLLVVSHRNLSHAETAEPWVPTPNLPSSFSTTKCSGEHERLVQRQLQLYYLLQKPRGGCLHR